MDVQITAARSAEDLQVAAKLFEAYAESLGIDLTFQGFAAELAGLPGKYGPQQGGELLLARSGGGEPLGCVALRALPTSSEMAVTAEEEANGRRRVGEMKRLYVSPRARGLGLGRLLAERIVERATAMGYDELRLDTLKTMGRAQDIYRRLGFVQIDAYYATPISATTFLSLDLQGAAAEGGAAC